MRVASCFDGAVCVGCDLVAQCLLCSALPVMYVFGRHGTVSRMAGTVRGYRLLYMDKLGMLSDVVVCAVRAALEILQIAVCVVNDALQVLSYRSLRCVCYKR